MKLKLKQFVLALLLVACTLNGASAALNPSDRIYGRFLGDQVDRKGADFTTSGSGTVTTLSVVSTHGFSGTVANATTTPAVTLSTSVSGVLKGSSGSLVTATAGTDYAAPTSGSSILYGDGAGGFSSVTVGTGLSFSAGTLSSSVALPLVETNGGTHQTTYAKGDILVGTASNTLGKKSIGVDGSVPVANASSTGGFDWYAECGEKIKPVSGRYLTVQSYGNVSVATLSSGIIYFSPITVCYPQTFTALSFASVVCTACSYKEGLYADAGGKATGTPIVSATVGPVTASVVSNEDGSITATTVNPGHYWLAIVSDTTGTANAAASAGQANIWGAADMTTAAGTRYTVSQSYATGLTDMTSVTPTVNGTNVMFYLGLKAQ